MSGSVLDDQTGEALPAYALQFAFGGTAIDVTSDDQGKFVLDPPAEAKTGTVACIDDPYLHQPTRKGNEAKVLEVTLPEPGTEWILRVPAGPTYRLQFDPPDVELPTQFMAVLYVASGRSSWALHEAHIRDGSPAWVRFGPSSKPPERAKTLRVATRDGLWTGQAPATIAKGIAPGVIALKLDAHASLTVRVTNPRSEPLSGVELHLAGADDREDVFGGLLQSTNVLGEGAYVGIHPAKYVVGARLLRYEPRVADVDLEPGKFAELDIVLQPVALVGSIEGEIVSDSGLYAGKVSLALVPKEAPSLALHFPVVWSDSSGRQRGKFRFEDLPAGAYHLTVDKQDLFEWDQLALDVRPPQAGIVLHVHDVPTTGIAFRMRNAATGESIDGAKLFLQLKGDATAQRSVEARDDVAAVDGVPAGMQFGWRLSKEGFQPEFGDQASFTREELRDGEPVRIAEVALHPGWGERYRVLQHGNDRPIAGATFLLDGAPVATSDENGYAMLRSGTLPAHIRVEREGFASPSENQWALMPHAIGYGLFTRIELAPAAK